MDKRILLVDDEEVITFGFSRALAEPGVVVDCAQSVDEAEGLVDASSYDAAVVDLRLSNSTDLDGLRLISLLRRTQANCRIIVVTAYGDDTVRNHPTVEAADLFYEKPVHPDSIKEALRILKVFA